MRRYHSNAKPTSDPHPVTTLRQGLDHLVQLGVSVNVASFVGATTLRVHEIGYDDRKPADDELERMRRLARDAAVDGALGLGSALIYTPGTFASTDELVALAEAAGGTYISHLRNEGDRLLEAVDELIEIARRARVRGEIYHLKQAGKANWSKLPRLDESTRREPRTRHHGGHVPYPRRDGSSVDAAGFRRAASSWIARCADDSVRERAPRNARHGEGLGELYLRPARQEVCSSSRQA